MFFIFNIFNFKHFFNFYFSSEDKMEKSDEEEDPLDAFMANIDKQAVIDKKESENKLENVIKTGEFEKGGQSGRDDIDDEDMQESYFKLVKIYFLFEQKLFKIYGRIFS